ncbi:MAG TPA: DUF2934 domain-containing protein [Bryobacteraceae bacterium]|jgi:hypothetical protein|nr:DUF2934 domain-containing protein [Bryobacteraceae bacterium]
MPSLEEQIRQRAYELYLERGEGPGTEVSDWLQAEAELNANQTPVSSKPGI